MSFIQTSNQNLYYWGNGHILVLFVCLLTYFSFWIYDNCSVVCRTNWQYHLNIYIKSTRMHNIYNRCGVRYLQWHFFPLHLFSDAGDPLSKYTLLVPSHCYQLGLNTCHDSDLPLHHIPNILLWIEIGWLWGSFYPSELIDQVEIDRTSVTLGRLWYLYCFVDTKWPTMWQESILQHCTSSSQILPYYLYVAAVEMLHVSGIKTHQTRQHLSNL